MIICLNLIIITLLVIIIFLIYIVLKKNKLIKVISKCVSMLKDYSLVEFYVFNMQTNKRYILDNNKLQEYYFDEKLFLSKMHPDDLPEYKKRQENFKKNIIQNSFIIRLLDDTTNKYHYYEYYVIPIIINNKKPKLLYSKRDITNQKRIEQEQQETIENLDLALASSNLTRWKYNIKEQTTSIKRYNTPEYTIHNNDIYSRLHPADKLISIEHAKDLNRLNELSPQVIRLYNDDKLKFIEIHSIIKRDSNRKPIGAFGIFKDITEIKKKEEELKDKVEQLTKANKDLKDSKDMLNLILDKLPIPVYIKDPYNKKHVYINDEKRRVFINKTGTRTTDFLIESNAILLESIDNQILESGEEYNANEQIIFHDGRIMETFVKKIPIEFEGKKQILVLRMDLTEQHKAFLAKKILSLSFDKLQAYTWNIDTRFDKLNIGDLFSNDIKSNVLDRKSVV